MTKPKVKPSRQSVRQVKNQVEGAETGAQAAVVDFPNSPVSMMSPEAAAAAVSTRSPSPGALNAVASVAADRKISSSALQGRINEQFDRSIGESILQGAVIVASIKGEIVVQSARGSKLPGGNDMGGIFSPLETDTVFDLAGLTTAICTATLIMRLVDSGRVQLSDRACRFLQMLGLGQKSQITLEHLLSNTSGLAAAPGIFDELVRANAGPRPGILASAGAKQYAYGHFFKTALRGDPGSRSIASDVNPILLGAILEMLTGMPLERAFHKFIAAPLKLKSLSFIDLTLVRRKSLAPVVEMFAPSGECSKRGKVVAGEVWDENTWVMGGVAGHNGLFGTASDVHTWASEISRAWNGKSELISEHIVKSFWSPAPPVSKEPVRLGFAVTSREDGFVDQKGSTEGAFTANALGSSVFIDPAREVVVVLLTNAGYSGQTNRRFLGVRSEIHEAILGAA